MTDKKNAGNIDISELLSHLKKSYLADIPLRLEEMETTILAMEQGPGFDEYYESLYRKVHSLKGSAGSYGLHIITSICHALEDLLNEVGRDKDRFNQYGVDYWLQYIDLIRAVLVHLKSSDSDFDKYEHDLKLLQSTRPGGNAVKLHCLVVTSSHVCENLLASAFDEDEIKFSFCYDGYKALGRLLTEDFDLLISDYEIPLLNGQALFGCLRLTESKNKDITTILLTSRNMQQLITYPNSDFIIQKDKSFSDNLTGTIRNIAKVNHRGQSPNIDKRMKKSP